MPFSEDWDKRQFQAGERARIVYFAWDYPSAMAAAASVPRQKGSFHPQDNRLIAEEPDAQSRGLNTYEVVVNFTKLQSTGSTSGNPLDEEAVWDFQPGEASEPVDIDDAGRPMVNMAGFPFKPAPHQELPEGFLIFMRNEARLEIPKHFAFSNKVNSEAISTPLGLIPKLCAKFKSYRPAREFRLSDSFVPCVYTWQIRPPKTKAELDGVVSPFDFRFLNQGNDGWFSSSGIAEIGRFVDKKGEPLSDVLLDGNGRPIETKVKVLDDGGNRQSAISNPKIPDTEYLERHPSTNAVAAYYRKCARVNFGPLGVF